MLLIKSPDSERTLIHKEVELQGFLRGEGRKNDINVGEKVIYSLPRSTPVRWHNSDPGDC